MAVVYRAEHAGQVKTRTSKGHNAIKFTHAWWAKRDGQWRAGFASTRELAERECRSYAKYGFTDTAVTECTGEIK